MRTIGVFKIQQSFNITQRGVVAFGYFTEGQPKIGSVTNINDKTAFVKVIGIEVGNIDNDGNLLFGLLLSFKDKDLEEIVKAERLKEQVVKILDS